MRCGESGNYLWHAVRKLWIGYRYWARPIQLRYFDPEDDQDSGEPDSTVPGGILQRLQPPAVHQSELRPGRHLRSAEFRGGQLRTDHLNQREPARDSVGAEVYFLKLKFSLSIVFLETAP